MLTGPITKSSSTPSNDIVPIVQMNEASSLPSDFSMFKIASQYGQESCKDFKTCMAIHRLLFSLRYYTSLGMQTNQDSQEIFISFAKEVYNLPLLIQDFYHFQKKHDEQLHEIMKYVIDTGLNTHCNINICDHALRHHRVENNRPVNENVKIDPHLKIYGETLDSFHVYLLHLYHVGLRCIHKSFDDEHGTGADNMQDDSYDMELARLRNMMLTTRDSSNRFDRMSPGNKFNIEINDTSI